MHKAHEHTKKLCEIKEKLTTCFEAEMAKGIEQMDVKEAGEVVDMIKDLCEAEKCIMEACYYKSVVNAMEEGSEEPRYGEVAGYNHNRYSSGRYAPSGHGHMSGYTPEHMIMPKEGQWMNWERHHMDGMRPMGYSKSPMTGNERHGRAYNDYQEAKRYYTESHDEGAKMKMEAHAKEHLQDTIATMSDIWEEADPHLRAKMKAELSKLMEQMR